MKITIKLIACHDTFLMELEWSDEAAPSELGAFLGMFGERADGRFRINAWQQATDEMKAAARQLAADLRKSAPHFIKLARFIGALEDGESFIFLDRDTRSTQEMIQLTSWVKQVNQRGDPDQEPTRFFGAVLDQYDMQAYDNTKPSRIGAKDPALKRCRFCTLTPADGATFATKAHAISEALGNKANILADECDDCNGYFGREVEPSFLNYMSIQRTFLGIRGKGNKPPTIQFSNGSVSHDGAQMVIASRGITETDTGLEVSLGQGPSFVPARCYRALCKFALSVIDEEHLADFAKLAKWVRYGDQETPAALPPLYSGVVPFDRASSPSITLYVRKTPHAMLPHVIGEFRVGPSMFVYALPYSTQDEPIPGDWFQREAFRSTFQHYQQVRWVPVDFSSTEVRELPTTLRATQRGSAGLSSW